MKRFYIDTYNSSASKISDVKYTKLKFMAWINMTFLHNQFQNQNFTFARFTQFRTIKMKFNPKTIAFIATLFSGLSVSVAQDYTNPDTTKVYDPYAPDSTTTIYESGAGNESTQPVKKPYVPFTVPFDTITELVTYTAIIEEEEAGTDSLYWRAKRWLRYEFKGAKRYLIKKDDPKEYKLVMEGEFPLFIEANKYSKSQNGKVKFDMEIRFKEGRYKYKINNLVHLVQPPPGEEKAIKTYFEFYRKSTINPKGNDAILIAADKQINTMITNLKKYCKEPIFVDEDDW